MDNKILFGSVFEILSIVIILFHINTIAKAQKILVSQKISNYEVTYFIDSCRDSWPWYSLSFKYFLKNF